MLTEEEQIEFCKVCSKRTFNRNTGIICSLTSKKPHFGDSCPDFKIDSKRVEKNISIKKGNQLNYQIDLDESEKTSKFSHWKLVLDIIKLIIVIITLVIACR